ncbi:MAG: hypothetical protein ACI9EZ_001024 [Halobacteriales archaeon]|jgi:hypothetical protein
MTCSVTPARVTVSITEQELNRDLSILLDPLLGYVVDETVVDAIHAAGLPVKTERC